MDTCEFVYITDTHLTKLRRLFPETHLLVTEQELEKPLKYAAKNGIQTIIHGGDVSDIPFLNHLYFKMLLKLIRRYSELSFYFLLGNHDYEDSETHSLQFLQMFEEAKLIANVRVVTVPTLFKIEGIPFNFVPFPYCQFKYAHPCINLAHLDVKGAVRDNMMRVTRGVDLSGTSKQFNIIGHIHKFQILDERTMYPAALYQTTFGEDPDKGFTHFRARIRNGKLRVDYKRVAGRQDFTLENLKIESKAGFKLIQKDPSILYKLHLLDGVQIPSKLHTLRPNVFEIKSAKSGMAVYNRDLSEDMYTGSETVNELISNDPLWKLREYLKQHGLHKLERKRAFQIVESILKHLEV
jgi:hypothetical protein